jgi:hypothetical protein
MFTIPHLKTLKFTKPQIKFIADTLGEVQDDDDRYEVARDTASRLACAYPYPEFDINQFLNDVENAHEACMAPDGAGPEDFGSDM